MALAFVHGVANRRGENYERGVAARDALFRRYIYPALQWDIHTGPFNAYWGANAAKFRWNHQSLPQEDVEAFGDDSDSDMLLLAEATGGAEVGATAPVSELSGRSVEDAVDLVWATAAQEIDDEDEAEQLAAWAYRASALMPDLQQDAALIQSTDDEQWLNTLAARIAAEDAPEAEQDVEEFGGKEFLDRLSESVTRIGSAAGLLSGKAATKLLRAQLHRQAAVFLGDVFAYLDQRGDVSNPGPIVTDVTATLDAAAKEDGPLVVVAHSMGGPIVYDVLSYYRPDLHVDKLVTVGSQVGLFEELCLLQRGKEAGCPPGTALVPRVNNIKEWINVFDRNDLLAFAAGRIFEGAEDFDYVTGKGVLAAHGAYFTMPSFFRRLAERVRV